MQVAICADTHVPTRASSIPEPFLELIESADHTIHAGDVESPETLETIRTHATELTAVYGNADSAELGLPSVATCQLEDVTFVVTHGTRNPVEAAVRDTTGGSVLTREEWLRAIADTARARTRSWDGNGVVGVGGHTHELEDTTHEGVRLLNPGTATGAAPADQATMLTATIDGGRISVTRHDA